MGEDRRKSVRIKKLLTVRYSYGINNSNKKWDITSIRDISETGISINTQQAFAVNDIITFLVKIPSRPLDWLEFTGRVVVSEELKSISGESVAGSHLTRVEFINLKEKERELIKEYVTWFLAKDGGGKK